MELTLSPEVESKLARLADARGSDSRSLAAELVSEGVKRISEYEEWFLDRVAERIADIKAGKTLSHEEVGDRMEAYFARKSHQVDLAGR